MRLSSKYHFSLIDTTINYPVNSFQFLSKKSLPGIYVLKKKLLPRMLVFTKKLLPRMPYFKPLTPNKSCTVPNMFSFRMKSYPFHRLKRTGSMPQVTLNILGNYIWQKVVSHDLQAVSTPLRFHFKQVNIGTVLKELRNLKRSKSSEFLYV